MARDAWSSITEGHHIKPSDIEKVSEALKYRLETPGFSQGLQ